VQVKTCTPPAEQSYDNKAWFPSLASWCRYRPECRGAHARPAIDPVQRDAMLAKMKRRPGAVPSFFLSFFVFLFLILQGVDLRWKIRSAVRAHSIR
jgi:hypothetical protein